MNTPHLEELEKPGEFVRILRVEFEGGPPYASIGYLSVLNQDYLTIEFGVSPRIEKILKKGEYDITDKSLMDAHIEELINDGIVFPLIGFFVHEFEDEDFEHNIGLRFGYTETENGVHLRVVFIEPLEDYEEVYKDHVAHVRAGALQRMLDGVELPALSFTQK